ncbi:CD276 antigen homolog [Lates japonicus]|uniref:CD276 antigen homolog n=1 Tax=Lates japonicus TaxID=270547 RepID=A0AAD3MCN5_LATJO|nr:CD276 antigen homolog [Lates japonicus]
MHMQGWDGKDFFICLLACLQCVSTVARTKIFPDLLSSGNFSLIIEPLMLKDDQTSLEVVFMQGNKEREKPCQLTLYVAVPFQEPETEINQANMTATCRTKGGYPKPEIKWSSGDGRTILEVQTKMTSEEDGTYSVSSTANITGLQKNNKGLEGKAAENTSSRSFNRMKVILSDSTLLPLA